MNLYEPDPSLQSELDGALLKLKYLKKGLAFRSLPSTNDWAMELARKGCADDGLVIATSLQPEGRGREKRPWLMEDGDLAISVVTRPKSMDNFTLLPLFVALAVHRALSFLGLKVFIKWPNDLVVEAFDQKPRSYFFHYLKLCGILIDTFWGAQNLRASIIGIGLNIVPKTEARALIPHIYGLTEQDAHITRAACLREILWALDQALPQMADKKFQEEQLNLFRKHCISLGRAVRLKQGEQELCGQAIDVSENGALILQTAEAQHLIYAGDITASHRCPD